MAADNPNDAFARVKFLAGLRLGLDAIDQIYSSTHGVTPHAGSDSRNTTVKRAAQSFGIDVPINPADAEPDRPAY